MHVFTGQNINLKILQFTVARVCYKPGKAFFSKEVAFKL